MFLAVVGPQKAWISCLESCERGFQWCTKQSSCEILFYTYCVLVIVSLITQPLGVQWPILAYTLLTVSAGVGNSSFREDFHIETAHFRLRLRHFVVSFERLTRPMKSFRPEKFRHPQQVNPGALRAEIACTSRVFMGF